MPIGAMQVEGQITREVEAQLVKQAQEGDRASMAALYRCFSARLYRQVIYPCLADAQMAEDVLKDTFLTMIQKIHTYEWQEAHGIYPWLVRIARNRALDIHRRLQREDRGQGAYREFLDALAGQPSAERILSEEQERKLLQSRVSKLLERLNPRYREVLLLRLFQEKSREECAALLEVKLGTLDVLFHRALAAFRKLWEDGDTS